MGGGENKGTEEQWWKAVADAVGVDQSVFGKTEDLASVLNRVCRHIVQLLEDAALLLEAGSHASAAFLAITAIEETAKAHMGTHRKRDAKESSKRSDPAFNHRKKHLFAAAPTIAMGSRLQAAIGHEVLAGLLRQMRVGDLVALREAGLYFQLVDGVLNTPSDAISKRLARDLTLLAIEVFDDGLVGYTNETLQLSERTDRLFNKIAQRPSD